MATLPITSHPTATAGEWARPAIRSPAGTPRRPATPARRAPAPVRAPGDDADENLARRASVGATAADRGVQRRAAAGRTVLAGRNPPSCRSCTPNSSSFPDAFVPPPNAVHGPRCPPTYQETVLPSSPSPRRFHLIQDVIDWLPELAVVGAPLRQLMDERLAAHTPYVVNVHGLDLPEIRNWTWG